jgi:CDP-paratose 2-epimerase
VYGDLEALRYEEQPTRYSAIDFPRGFDESLPLHFCSPYGCSKGSVDQYMLDYARMFGLNTIVFRHSSVFGVRQFSTFDQGWIGWFVQQALRARNEPRADPFTISGNGKQVRDVLFIDDLVRCYFAAADHVEAARGKPFNIGGGISNSLSLLELFELLEQHLGVTLAFRCLPWRQSDQKVFVADTSLAESTFGWRPSTGTVEGVGRMITWMEHQGA